MGENKYFLIGVVVAIIVAGVLIFATGNYGTVVTGSTVFNPDAENVKNIHISVSEYGFEPNVITVNKDEHIRFYLRSLDYPHSLEMGDFDVYIEPVKPGQLGKEEFVADKKGEFYFYDDTRAYLERFEGREEMLRGMFIVQ